MGKGKNMYEEYVREAKNSVLRANNDGQRALVFAILALAEAVRDRDRPKGAVPL